MANDSISRGRFLGITTAAAVTAAMGSTAKANPTSEADADLTVLTDEQAITLLVNKTIAAISDPPVVLDRIQKLFSLSVSGWILHKSAPLFARAWVKEFGADIIQAIRRRHEPLTPQALTAQGKLFASQLIFDKYHREYADAMKLPELERAKHLQKMAVIGNLLGPDNESLEEILRKQFGYEKGQDVARARARQHPLTKLQIEHAIRVLGITNDPFVITEKDLNDVRAPRPQGTPWVERSPTPTERGGR